MAEVAAKLPAGKVETLQLDATDKEALVHALAGVDLCFNALIPELNLDIMAACLESGTNYLDMAAAGPRDMVGTADVDEEIALDAEFKKKGLTALVFFGIDPGASDVFARALYDQFDTVERLTCLDGDNSSADGRRLRAELLADHDGRGVPHPAAARLRGRQEDPPAVARPRPASSTFRRRSASSRCGTSTTKRPSSCPCS